MPPSVRRDALTAAIAALFAFLMFYAGWALPLGTALRMGPGYVPRLVAVALLAVALIIAVRAVVHARRARSDEDPTLPVTWKGLAFIGAGVLAFALLIQPLGLIASAIVAVVLTSLAQAANGLRERLALAAGLAVFTSLVFPLALDLPLPVLPRLF